MSGGEGKNNETRTVRYTLKDIPQSQKSCHLQDDLDGLDDLDGHLRRSSLWLDLSPGNRDRHGAHCLFRLLFPVERVFFSMRP